MNQTVDGPRYGRRVLGRERLRRGGGGGNRKLLAQTGPDLAPARPPVTPGSVARGLFGAESMSWLTKLPLWRGTVVLAYHRMHREGEETPFDPGTFSASPSAFDAQLAFIARHFEVVSPEAIARDPESRDRRVILTFDDGYRDNYELALPVLRKHGATATFFLTTRRIDDPDVAWWDELAWIVKRSPRDELEPGPWLRRALPLDGDRRSAITELARVFKSLPSDRTESFLEFCADAAGTGRCDADAAGDLWMTWEMAAELRDAGMTVGGHSATHPVLGRARPEVQNREIEECARRLDEELGVPMRFFAYPVGLPASFNDATRRLLRHAGVELAFSLYGGYLRPGRLDPYDVPRASVAADMSPRAFRAMLALPRLFARW